MTPLFLCLVLAVSTAAEPAAARAVAPWFSIDAVRTEQPPLVDGVIEALWQSAPEAGQFIQFESQRGAPDPLVTTARVLYDDKFVYVAFRVSDIEPPTAQITRRDELIEDDPGPAGGRVLDDAVVLILDTYADGRTAYCFIVNPLGTQADGRINEDGRTMDTTWDAPWSAAVFRDGNSWSVEMTIPLRSIKYVDGKGVHWGINFGRSHRRSLGLSFWSGPLDHPFRVSQAGTIRNLDLPPPPGRLSAIVYALGRLAEGRSPTGQAGGDLRYAITSELGAQLTINPDFATIEADDELVNLTRFELDLREKRPFFLEGAEMFRQRIRTFYSRRIAEIDAGTRVLGKVGPWTTALLSAYGRPAVPPPEPGVVAPPTPDALFNVHRLGRDLWTGSNVALTWADRFMEGDHAGSLGLDTTLFFTRYLGMTAQAVRSYGPANQGPWAYFVRPSYDSPTGHAHLRYTHLGDTFQDNANVVGFIRDDNRRELDAALEKTFWIRQSWLQKITYDSNYNIFWSQQNRLRSWEIVQEIGVDFRNRLGIAAEHVEDFQRFEKDFRNRLTTIALGYNRRSFQQVMLSYGFGRNFDRDVVLIEASAAVKPLESLALQYDLIRARFEPDPDDETTFIHVARASQFFTPDLYLQFFLQANTVLDRTSVNAVFVYRYKPPFGLLQLAYQHGNVLLGEDQNQGHTLFLKTTLFL